MLYFVYRLSEASVIASNFWRYLLNSTFSPSRGLCIFSRSGVLGFIRTVNFSLSTNYILVGPKSVYASVVLNSITTPDSCKIASIKRKFVSRYHLRVLIHMKYKNVIIIVIYLSWSWATCWPVPVSRIQKFLQRSTMIPSASWVVVFHYPG